jgi:hypothetical protein
LQTNKINLSCIAHEIGIVSRDGNPISQNMLDNMVSLDEQRIANFQALSKVKNNSSVEEQSGSISCNNGKASSSRLGDVMVEGFLGGCSKPSNGSEDQPILIEDSEEG